MEKLFSVLLDGAGAVSLRGAADAAVSGLAYDSRQIKPGWAFFALPGIHADGNAFVEAAIDRGATAVVYAGELERYRPDVAYAMVDDPRAAMSVMADRFWDSPSARMAVVGVTGTEGKSTTVWLIYRLLDLAGRKAGFISTVEYRVAGRVEANPEHQTTPEATTIHAKLAEMAANGFEYAVVESSSHGLSPRTARLSRVAFDVGVMTNVRHEHLEFHGTWERYRDDKSNLFRALDAASHEKALPGGVAAIPSFGVVCADDDSADWFRAVTRKPVYSYSMKSPGADLYATGIEEDDRGASFTVVWEGRAERARIELPGLFNVENTLAAMLVVMKLCGIPLSGLLPLLPRLEPVRGRMTRVDLGQPFELLVDYAHTPTSFEAVLPPLKARTRGRLIALFGSGGERDTQKRPEQGRIAAGHADIVILSDEDPRGEDPMALLEDIAAGCAGKRRGEGLFLIPDRREAIGKAISLARPGDIVVLLGKGHENSIIYASGTIPWNEIEEAEAALRRAGYERTQA